MKKLLLLSLIFFYSCGTKLETKQDLLIRMYDSETSNYIRYGSLYIENLHTDKREIYFDSLEMSFYTLDLLSKEINRK